jgi:2'-5' RNA ligase
VPRSALIAEVPEAEEAVGGWRLRYGNAGLGIPAHITLLMPFVPTDRLGEDIEAGLRELFAAQPPISFALTSVMMFPDETVWLKPEPSEPFRSLTELIVERHPEYPPYEGMHKEIVPHLTVTSGNATLRNEVEAAVSSLLPIAAETHEVTLLAEDEDGMWTVGGRYPLAGIATGPLTARRL